MTNLMAILFNQGKPLPKAPKARLRELCETRKKKSELTAGDMVFAALREIAAPCRSRDIVDATGLSHQVVGYHLDRFRKAGAVIRHEAEPRAKGHPGQLPVLWSIVK